LLQKAHRPQCNPRLRVTSRTSDGSRRRKRLSGSGDLSGGVDVGAEKGLSENGDQAAFGLLATLGAGVDEGVDGGRGDRSYRRVSRCIVKTVVEKTYEERSPSWRG
jgi:hypothetical protein